MSTVGDLKDLILHLKRGGAIPSPQNLDDLLEYIDGAERTKQLAAARGNAIEDLKLALAAKETARGKKS